MTRTRNAAPILLALSVVAGISGESILGLINETVTFQLKVDEIPKGITWKFNEDKVCEIDSTGDVCFSYYKGRANINKTNGFLTISNLVNSDAGKYTAEIHQPTVKEFIFQLEVLGKVTRPKITCNGSVYQATLSCETSGDSYTTLKWDQDGQSVPASNGPITLTIEKRRGSHYTCISNNTVSEARNIFAPDECFLKDDRSRIGLFLAVIFMILIPATAYGVFKAFSKKRNEQTPEAEKLMKDSKEPHSEEPGPPMTNCPSDLSSNHGIMSEMAFEEPARSFHNNEPKDVGERKSKLTQDNNLDKETAPEDPSYVTAGNETTREKPSSTTADKEAAPEEQSNITADEKKDPGNPFDTTEGNETPQEKPSSTTADKEAAPEEQSNITADEKKDPGNPFDTTEGNETPQEKPSSTTADKEAAPEEQSNITADKEAAPEEQSNITEDEKKDPGNPFDTTAGNETPQEKPSSTTADKEAAPEEQSNITADEKKDPGNPFDTTEGKETPREKPSSTTADKEAAPEEQSNITADEKKDPGNPFDTTEGNETPQEKPSSTTAD
ncbi:protein starmaker-like isoform X48 [Erpetoichthys calabaricus]|uniref:protein starmaker-like isoform X30 n=1 Tax=Erpetoichthys calabaricus TaxID=27687 RepID=UPI00223494A5|nr:protein starmaker-like isoform X30 [Erpetoichthys calabaricus]XP_051781671.1 protein starmaker-like isoform X31 [Erpetoichthys calabaricus]XP_051781672.1 protein starmaker-like isoform X32 [Erpetoichthys calabaricus]XP_051781673.1 protein starmaker-like isoform X33 [Erpetoichthys calabaricus]XP_051781674.1 protein starmaker-like isoform X34 [Erpetoichthys calabaricus]XP_051781675.1 protein starmaker-like isoform X35 [Erpetoichthys calabaricus]XP_051781676.1 protein starmaker-like isoform X